jgi:hypothetical protein
MSNVQTVIPWGHEYWKFIHIMALQVDKGICKFTERNVSWLLNTVDDMIPCNMCKGSIKKFMTQTPFYPYYESGNLFDWTMLLHNDINNKRGVDIVDSTDLYKKWEYESVNTPPFTNTLNLIKQHSQFAFSHMTTDVRNYQRLTKLTFPGDLAICFNTLLEDKTLYQPNTLFYSVLSNVIHHDWFYPLYNMHVSNFLVQGYTSVQSITSNMIMPNKIGEEKLEEHPVHNGEQSNVTFTHCIQDWPAVFYENASYCVAPSNIRIIGSYSDTNVNMNVTSLIDMCNNVITTYPSQNIEVHVFNIQEYDVNKPLFDYVYSNMFDQTTCYKDDEYQQGFCIGISIDVFATLPSNVHDVLVYSLQEHVCPNQLVCLDVSNINDSNNVRWSGRTEDVWAVYQTLVS